MTGSAISAGVIAEVVVAARALLRVESGEDVVLARLASAALLQLTTRRPAVCAK